ncbi:hypothetical protein [Acinetobacter junii]|uniref:hypothetical protein n=1 Tax=Acinetobacter junii TaxID=40215 RepID=UPI00100E7557|nr:hypothetical protein [Acinetobacter junii]RXS92959.1 hypothetical protein ETZ13_14255 [Acinetobacter junii]
MKLSKKVVGTVISTLWLLLTVGFSIYQREDFINMKPNEFGDFLAGVFAPLGFLWLVLGYLQQGDELKQNTDALILQANELHQNVIHQERLVDLAYKQHQELLNEKDNELCPKFKFTVTLTRLNEPQPNFYLMLQNTGMVVSNLSIINDKWFISHYKKGRAPNLNQKKTFIPLVEYGGVEYNLVFCLKHESPIFQNDEFIFKYDREDGQTFQEIYVLNKNEHSIPYFTLIESKEFQV